VKSILPKEKLVVLSDGTAVEILHAATHPALGERDEERGRKPTPFTNIWIARFEKIPARSESLVEVQCDAPGLRFLQYSLMHSSTGVYMANGLAEILSNRPFRVHVVNASSLESPLPKGMVLGHDFTHPTGIVSLVKLQLDSLPSAKTVPKGFQIALST
jgi:hypothetical protein